MRRIILGLLISLILALTVTAVNDKEIKPVLQKALQRHYEKSKQKVLDIDEIKDLLDYYLRAPTGIVNVYEKGKFTGKSIKDTFSKGLRADAEPLTDCSEGWYCLNKFTKVNLKADCTWTEEVFCNHGCSDNECRALAVDKVKQTHVMKDCVKTCKNEPDQKSCILQNCVKGTLGQQTQSQKNKSQKNPTGKVMGCTMRCVKKNNVTEQKTCTEDCLFERYNSGQDIFSCVLQCVETKNNRQELQDCSMVCVDEVLGFRGKDKCIRNCGNDQSCVEKCLQPDVACEDTDGGIVYSQKGSCKDDYYNGVDRDITIDICDTSNVIEWACVDKSCVSETYACPSGCAEGACKPDTPNPPSLICEDSDGGKTSDVKGVCNDGTTYDDTCTQNSLTEWYCADSGCNSESYVCTSCVDGACVLYVPVLKVDLSKTTYNIGEIVYVPIVVENIKSLYAVQFNLNYDETVLEYSKMVKGDFLGTDTFWLTPKANDSVVKNVVATRLGDTSVDGSGTVVTLEFISIAQGPNEFTFDNVLLANENVEEISVEKQPGSLCVETC